MWGLFSDLVSEFMTIQNADSHKKVACSRVWRNHGWSCSLCEALPRNEVESDKVRGPANKFVRTEHPEEREILALFIKFLVRDGL